MKMTMQLVVCEDDGREETITDVVILEKTCQQLEQVGLTLAEAKTLLQRLQQQLVERQATAFVATRMHCQACGALLSTKGHHALTFRTLFGIIRLTSPRLCHCPCMPHETATFSPVTTLLPEHTAPELLFMETKWASLVSYGLTVQALTDFLPIDETLSVSTVRTNALAVAQRCEAELGEEQMSFIDGCPRDWGHLPIPDGPVTVGIDGGYVRDWDEKKRQFEVIVGKSILAFKREDEEEDIPSSKCFGFVQTLDTKPKRRLFEVLKSQGLQMNQQLTFLSDGGDTVRDLQLYLSPEAEHLLDWFHVSMRLTVLQQTAKGLPDKIRDEEEDYPLRDPVVQELERLKWFLWHGNVYKALQVVQSVEMDLDAAVAARRENAARKLLTAVAEFHTYIENNQGFIPNYGERYRHGERISTGFVESTVNQVVSKRFCKKQQMQWTKRAAHLLLQMRVKTLNHELATVFRRWYPDFPVQQDEARRSPQICMLSYQSVLNGLGTADVTADPSEGTITFHTTAWNAILKSIPRGQLLSWYVDKCRYYTAKASDTRDLYWSLCDAATKLDWDALDRDGKLAQLQTIGQWLATTERLIREWRAKILAWERKRAERGRYWTDEEAYVREWIDRFSDPRPMIETLEDGKRETEAERDWLLERL